MTCISGEVNDLGSILAALTNELIITDETGAKLVLEPNLSLPVTIQDQTTPPVILKFSNLEQSTTLTVTAAINTRTFTVADPTGIIAGKQLVAFSPSDTRFSTFCVTGVAGSVITVCSPIDFAYPAGSYIDVSSAEMAVNGSVTPVTFGLRNNAGAAPQGVALSMDVTRIMMVCQTGTSPELNEFGDFGAALANGIVMRRRDGAIFNIFNVKTNGDIALMAYDWSQISGGFFGAAQPGFFSRLTFAGQNKMGVVLRIDIDEDIEIIIQDNLTGLDSLQIMAEGSIVQP